MRRPARVPVPAEGQENDVVARIIAAQSAARRCSDAAEEIFPTVPEAARDTLRGTPLHATPPGANGRGAAKRRTPDPFTLRSHPGTA